MKPVLIRGTTPHWPQLAQLSLLALAYFASAKLGLAFHTQDSLITLFWLPSGIAVAALFRCKFSCWPGIFLGALAIELSLGNHVLAAIGIATGNTLAPLACVWLLKYWAFTPSFSRQRDLLSLLTAAALGMLLSSSIGISTLLLNNMLAPDNTFTSWLNWWMGDTVGVLIAAPLLLNLSRSSLAEFRHRPAEFLLSGFLIVLAGWMIFCTDHGAQGLPLAFLPMPLLVWSALRLGLIRTSILSMMLSLLATVGSAMGNGVFGALPLATEMYLAWLYMLAVTLINLIVITILGEREDYARNLKRVNDLLSLAQQAAKAGVWNRNLATKKLTWSDELYQLFGLTPAAQPIRFEDWLALIHPEDREGAKARAIASEKNDAPLTNEYRIVTPDGKTKWIMALGNVQKNEHGETTDLSGMCIDITEQKQLQQKVLTSESRYQTLLQHAADAMFIHDFNGHLLEVNQQACDTLGYSREELCGMWLGDIAPGFELNVTQPKWEQLEIGKPVCFNSTHRRKDGSTFPVEVRLVALEINAEKMIMALTNDITARLQAATAMQESESRYRNFADKLPLGIAVLQDGLIKYANHATTELIGYSLEELLEKPFGHLIHEDDRPAMIELHRRRMQGENVEGVFAVRMIRKDGVMRQWELHTSTTEWYGKRSSLAIMVDITQRVAMEEALRDSVHQLEEKELAKTRFLAAAGHDLRQPVAAANLFVDALKLTPVTTHQKDLLERLDQSMSVFSSLLERLLDISKFDAGLIKPKFTKFNLTELFNWLEQNFAQTALDKQLSFRLFFPLHQALIVRTDIGLLQSAVMNLVSNAIKFTSHGGILISARRRGNKVLLQVWDTGCGIAEADMRHIFDEFYQVNNPHRNRESGLGLGLSICQRAASLLHSKITCRSQLGRGSVFELELPLNIERRHIGHLKADSGMEGNMPARYSLNGKRIVVLEDDKLVSKGLVQLLQGLEAEVQHFHNVELALQQANIATADFYIVDHALSGKLNGLQFLESIQQQHSLPVKAVIITGETSSQFISKIASSPWPVLHKPFNLGKLIATLQAAHHQ